MNSKRLMKEAQFHGARRTADLKYGSTWCALLSLLLCCCVYALYLMITRFLHNPTYVSRIKEVRQSNEFPCLRVCPPIRLSERRMDEFMENLKTPADMQKSHIRKILPQLAAVYSQNVQYSGENLVTLESFLQHNDMTFKAAMMQLVTPCEELLLRCRWQGETGNCSAMFRMEITGAGFCCTFNGRSRKREFEENYSVSDSDIKRLYTITVGPRDGLVVAVSQRGKHERIDLSYPGAIGLQGRNFVDPRYNVTPLNPGTEHWFSFVSRMQAITDNAKGLSSSLRKCRLRYAEPLEFFPLYGQWSCHLECEMLESVRICGCLHPAHPVPPARGYHSCNASRLGCARESARTINVSRCMCLPTCEKELFRIKPSEFRLMPAPSYDSFYHGLNLSEISVVRLFIASHIRNSFVKNNYFSYLDLFSQFGGIFNLCFGCSVLTLIELIVMLKYCLKGRSLENKTEDTTYQNTPKTNVTKIQVRPVK